MSNVDANGGFVQVDTDGHSCEMAPHEAERWAMNLLSKASEARAQQQAEQQAKERAKMLAALARLASTSTEHTAGYDDQAPCDRVRLWVVGTDSVGAWPVPEDVVPEGIDQRPCPGEPEADALEVLAGLESAGAEPAERALA